MLLTLPLPTVAHFGAQFSSKISLVKKVKLAKQYRFLITFLVGKASPEAALSNRKLHSRLKATLPMTS